VLGALQIPSSSTMSYRQSVTPPPNSTPLTPSLQTLLAKQQEHAGLQALREASANLVEKVEELARMGNVMADGGEG
jgi:DASH complex subunit DAD2